MLRGLKACATMPGMSVFCFVLNLGLGIKFRFLCLYSKHITYCISPKMFSLFVLRQGQIILWVVKDDLECLILFPPSFECWDYRFVPPCLAQQLFLYQHLCVAIPPIPYVHFALPIEVCEPPLRVYNLTLTSPSTPSALGHPSVGLQ